MSSIRDELERIRRMADPKKGERSGLPGVVLKAKGLNKNMTERLRQEGRWRYSMSDEAFHRLWLEEGNGDVAHFARLIGEFGVSRVRQRLRRLGLLA